MKLIKFWEKANEKEIESNAILKELESVSLKRKEFENRFNLVEDSDLIDSCIYEKKALDARYKFLITRAKEMHLKNFSLIETQNAVAISKDEEEILLPIYKIVQAKK